MKGNPNSIETPTGDVVPFLTAWDPSDLPGGSIDPLGFDRGYGGLADKILPGLTNVARQPRYFGIICAGASLGPDTISPSRADVQERQDSILRLERFWALANVLVSADGGPSASGIRGVTYAETHRRELMRTNRRSTSQDFILLSRQLQYGVIGIYGNVAHGMRLFDRKTLGLTPDFGEALGSAFLEETCAPRALLAAVKDTQKEVGLDVLLAWGKNAHLAGKSGRREARILGEALHLNRVRARMAEAAAQHPPQNGETELKRLRRISRGLGKTDKDLSEAIEAILAYEKCFASVQLSFERILWRCGGAGAVALSELASDEVIQRCASTLPDKVARLESAIENAATAEFKQDLERLKDVRSFLVDLSKASCASGGLLQRILQRHADVQGGKFDRGRRKLPWVEAANGNATLTLSRATQVGREPCSPDDIAPHEYRMASADALVFASRGARS